MVNDKPIRLHLGCGENYLPGYINIDLPSGRQTLMRAKADIYKDVRELQYDKDSVDEIRNHHLLEHFSRQEALSLLLKWRRWLKPGGLLVVETPDFERMTAIFRESDLKVKFKLARHFFGSQESEWAYHKDFWGRSKFSFVLEKLEFEIVDIQEILSYLGRCSVSRFSSLINRTGLENLKNATGDRLPNILVIAKKRNKEINEKEIAKEILSLYLVGNEINSKLLEVWLKDL